jgi:hypothetical protein
VQSPHDVEPALPAEIDVDEATSGECSSALRIPSAPVVALAHDPKALRVRATAARSR